MTWRTWWLLGLVGLFTAPTRAAPPDLARHGETQLAVGLRGGSVESAEGKAAVTGTLYTLRQELAPRAWLRIRLSWEQQELEGDELLGGALSFTDERSILRVGLAPRLQAGNVMLSGSAEALMLELEQRSIFAGDGGEQMGFGVGGTSAVRLGPRTELSGEAMAYSVGGVQMLSGSMRLSFTLLQRAASSILLGLGADERSWRQKRAELREGGLSVGLIFRF